MRNTISGRPAAAVATALLLLTGCASSVPRPSDRLSTTQAAIAAARDADASRTAPALLESAQNKLSNARDAIDQERFRKASWLLEEAEVEADLAKARAETADMQRALDKLHDNTESLQRRLDAESS